MSKALTITIVFRANSLNYGEGVANIAELKKIYRANGDVLTFASRQSIRYDIVRLGNQWFGWKLNTVVKKGTLQFRDDVSIADSVEMDLFGYLKTGGKSQKRPAVARLSHAVSLEPYRGDLEFLNNMGLAERIGETPNLANIEIHESLYTYTLTLDMNRVGRDGELKLPDEIRVERIHQLLDIIKLLNRNIRGRQESLAPLFVIGGVYPVANPFFLGRVELEPNTKKWNIKTRTLNQVCELSFGGRTVREDTSIGYVAGVFGNEDEFAPVVDGRAFSVEQFFIDLKNRVSDAIGAVVK